MKFVLIAFVFGSLQHLSSQNDIYQQLFRPYSYNSYYRYAQPAQTMFRYSQPIAVYRSVYRNSIPENRSFGIASKYTNNDQMRSHLDDLVSRMKLTMMQMSNKKDQSSKTDANPNDVTYKGRRTRKTLVSFRSASV